MCLDASILRLPVFLEENGLLMALGFVIILESIWGWMLKKHPKSQVTSEYVYVMWDVYNKDAMKKFGSASDLYVHNVHNVYL